MHLEKKYEPVDPASEWHPLVREDLERGVGSVDWAESADREVSVEVQARRDAGKPSFNALLFVLSTHFLG